LGQTVEEFAARSGDPAIEAKGKLVEVVIEVPLADRALLGAEKPSFQ
jgi:hypothetical protein